MEARVATLEQQMKEVAAHVVKANAHIVIAEPHIEETSKEVTRMKELLDKHVGEIVELQKVHDATLREDVPKPIQQAKDELLKDRIILMVTFANPI